MKTDLPACPLIKCCATNPCTHPRAIDCTPEPVSRETGDYPRIWLGPKVEEYDSDGRMWCQDKIWNDGVEYVHASQLDAANAEIERLKKTSKAIMKAGRVLQRNEDEVLIDALVKALTDVIKESDRNTDAYNRAKLALSEAAKFREGGG